MCLPEAKESAVLVYMSDSREGNLSQGLLFYPDVSVRRRKGEDVGMIWEITVHTNIHLGK